jgi:anaerobic ribonucleoside-triphosphate reductase activating protein
MGNTKDTSITHTGIIYEANTSGGKMMVHQFSDHGCRRKDILNLAGFLPRSEVNGPGSRAVVWVQGCPIRCRGCFNEAYWPFSPANLFTVDELASRITTLPDIDGVTFSGGEPFAQAGALAILGDRVKEAGLSLVTYTGFTPGQLAKGHCPTWDHLLRITDLLIAGPYMDELACKERYRGSSNQQVIPLSGRIMPVFPGHYAQEDQGGRVEFTIGVDGSITTSGFPDKPFVEQLAHRCRGA